MPSLEKVSPQYIHIYGIFVWSHMKVQHILTATGTRMLVEERGGVCDEGGAFGCCFFFRPPPRSLVPRP